MSTADFIMSRIAVDTITQLRSHGSSVADNAGLMLTNLVRYVSFGKALLTDWTNSYMVKHLSTDTQVLTGTVAPAAP